MDYKTISALLEKYWEGATSLAEEAELKAFFNEPHDDLPEDLQEAAPLFQYLDDDQHFPAEPEWDMSFLQETPPQQAPARVVRMQPFRNWMKYAAVVLMLAGIAYAFRQHQENKLIAARQEAEERKAYMEAKKALALLSRNFNKGTEKMQQLSYFNTAVEKVSGSN
ncbi:hypothetical protein [Chitinophaga sp. CB10]|uniref:hypothetical protein n=1 Tax=Chitinophaga sp. CB10 TaxID=1891659 RepID=UPI0025C05A33|nr:hypothetical protein [Chitinophaga sp. CB10]